MPSQVQNLGYASRLAQYWVLAAEHRNEVNKLLNFFQAIPH